MGLSNYRKPWTEEDEAILEKNHGILSYTEIGEILERTAVAVQGRAQILGLLHKKTRDWGKRETEEFIEMYPVTTNIELSLIFGRGIKAIRNKASYLKLHKKKEFKAHHHGKTSRSWTDEEIEILKRDYPNTATHKLKLSRTVPAIQIMARKLGISKSPRYIQKCRYRYGQMMKQGKL